MAIDAIASPTNNFPRRRYAEPWAEAGPSKRPRRAQSEDEYLADCLVMLSRGRSGAAVPESPSPATPFACTVCGKAFPSYQALGGHKSSHSAKAQTAAAAAVSSYASPMNPSGKAHECNVCHRVFPTGQALGGHKRRHYEGVIGAGAAASRSRTSSSNGGGGSRIYIDLNLPPPSPDLRCDEEVESTIR